jgi:Putative zinc-binding metallo-peptidase
MYGITVSPLLSSSSEHFFLIQAYQAFQAYCTRPRGVIAIASMKQIVVKNIANTSKGLKILPKAYRHLMAQSVASLTPKIQNAGFEALIAKLNDELAAKNLIHLNIETYFGDEWFCPDQSTAIAIPFWLADDRLRSIERTLIGFVEGETEDEFIRLLRHEAGHCVEHAYRLSRRKDWRETFGNPNIKYDPEFAATIPGAPDFVVNLSGGYAQTHPEEDFAETFAVVINPKSNYRKIYQSKSIALKKLIFVEKIIAECAQKKPRALASKKISNARRMRRSLESYYQTRLRSQSQAALPN